MAHWADHAVAVLDIEGTPLHGEEHDFGIEPIDHEVRGIGQKAMVVLDIEMGRRRVSSAARENTVISVATDRRSSERMTWRIASSPRSKPPGTGDADFQTR
jgi:hypothetical protein